MTQLTEFEKEMHQKLCEKRDICFYNVDDEEKQALNELIRNGLASYSGEEKRWFPIST